MTPASDKIDRLYNKLSEMEETLTMLEVEHRHISEKLNGHERVLRGEDGSDTSMGLIDTVRNIRDILKRREKLEWLIITGFIGLLFSHIGYWITHLHA